MNNIKRLQDTWEFLAQKDSLWAICSDPARSGNRWEVRDFMDTGKREISAVMKHLFTIGFQPDFSGEALDFGCGVGRLTQAMTCHFRKCVGVDISETMIAKANSLNTEPLRCRYIRNQTPALRMFDDSSFSFVYSNITLQHMPQTLAKHYLKEFVRLLKPEGVLVFQTVDVPLGMIEKWRAKLRIRTRIRSLLGAKEMLMHCFPDEEVRSAILPARIVDVRFTNASQRNFNGNLEFREKPLTSGHVSRQYCAVR